MAASASASTVTFFTDKASFDAATTGVTFTTDDFSTDIAAAESITFSSGVTSTLRGGDITIAVTFGDNQVGSSRYSSVTDGGGSFGAETIDWLFPSAVTAIAFDYSDVDLGGLNIQVGGVTRDVVNSGISTFQDGFLGLVSTTALTSLTFGNSGSSSPDLFQLDNLQFGAAASDPSVIPLPAALPLLLAGLGGLGLLRARRTA